METVPGYVSAVFILTTFLAVAFLLQSAKTAGLSTLPGKVFLFLLPLWIVFQSVLAIGGFYQDGNSVPPRIFLFGVLPTLAFMLAYFIFFRNDFIDRLPLSLLTLLHCVRIPVELVLFWLFGAKVVPQIMTFAGWNFDILSGILALIVYVLVFRLRKAGSGLLIAFNVVGLLLLLTIVSIAVLSLPSPIQKLSFDQPNQAVLYFPYVFLPTIIVPIVLFSHLTALYKTLRGETI